MKVFYHFKVLHRGTERKERKIVKGKWGPVVWFFFVCFAFIAYSHTGFYFRGRVV